MKTRLSKANKQQQPTKNLAEEALEIAIKNATLNPGMIRALRLTCKRTKVAADAEVRKFTLRLDQWQNSEVVGRSGLLKHITRLTIYFDFEGLANTHFFSKSWNLAGALRLLNLAVDVCKSLRGLKVLINASPTTIYECGSVLGKSNWECLREVSMVMVYPMPGFISGILARPPSSLPSLPALKSLICQDPSTADLEALDNSGIVGNLTTLRLFWCSHSYETNTAPATVAAVRNLLQQATSLENLHINSYTSDYYEFEKLNSLKYLNIGEVMHHFSTDQEGTADYASVLARPWPKLEYLRFEYASLSAPNVVRIFEAQDTLPALRFLFFCNCSFEVQELSYVCRPHLEKFSLLDCDDGHELLTTMAQLMENDIHALPSLRNFEMNCQHEDPISSALEALSKFLSCPFAAALEELCIYETGLGPEKLGLLFNIANYCLKLKHLDLHLTTWEDQLQPCC